MRDFRCFKVGFEPFDVLRLVMSYIRCFTVGF